MNTALKLSTDPLLFPDEKVDIESTHDLDNRGTTVEPRGSGSVPERLYGKTVEAAITYDVFRRAKRLETSERVSSFRPLQEWEGYVTEIADDCFRADIVDTSSSATRDICGNVEIGFEELSGSGRRLLAKGAVFRWSIGYAESNGTYQRVSQVVFRDLPNWTKDDLATKGSIDIGGLDWK
jgi:hypothetical protein